LVLFFKKERLAFDRFRPRQPARSTAAGGRVSPPRRNLIHAPPEVFKPPVFKPNTTLRNRAENGLRRFLDLQSATAWRDMQTELAGISGSLIDIGCGAQVFRPLVPQGVRYLGIDTADAKARFGYDVPDTLYFEGDDWGVAPGSFDAALCTEVLEHIADPLPFLRRIHACLRPGGSLILTVPFAARWHFVPYDYWRYTPSSLEMLLRAADFGDITVTARGNPITVACYKVMALVLILLFGDGARLGDGARRSPLRLAGGLLLLPLLAGAACLANLTLNGDWGEDCLGYTVTARRGA